MTSGLLVRWATAFALTQAIEVPIYMRGLRVSALAAFGASALTHPVVWFVIHPLWELAYVRAGGEAAMATGSWSGYLGFGLVAEGFAVLAEALYFRRAGAKRALQWSLLANATSALIGLASYLVFGWPS